LKKKARNTFRHWKKDQNKGVLEMKTKNKENKVDCSPLNSLYCNLKIRITGGLNQHDMNHLYSCNLCNDCRLGGVNYKTREITVSKGLEVDHLVRIRENIKEQGNSYGIIRDPNDDSEFKGKTLLFRGCTPTYQTPEILKSAENLLKSQGVEYSIMGDEICCGNILFNLGDEDFGGEVVKGNIARFKAAGVERIITICPGCYHAFNKYYSGKEGFNPEIVLALDLLPESNHTKGNFHIQDPCHAREKAEKVRRIVPNSNNDGVSPCCGAGGGVMAHNKLLATNKAVKTLENKKKVVTYCPFCYLNLSTIEPHVVQDLYMLLEENLVTIPEAVPYY
jgi:Fe-S oxidoreductase